MSSVKVTANADGLVVVTSENNPEYGYIRLEQKTTVFANGWAQPKVKSALLRGRVEDLKALNFTKDQTLPGKIVVKESFIPSNPNDVNQDMKLAGTNGIPCTKDDQPIYRVAFYTEDLNDQDVLIQHDNVDEIRRYQAAQKTSMSQGANLNS